MLSALAVIRERWRNLEFLNFELRLVTYYPRKGGIPSGMPRSLLLFRTGRDIGCNGYIWVIGALWALPLSLHLYQGRTWKELRRGARELPWYARVFRFRLQRL